MDRTLSGEREGRFLDYKILVTGVVAGLLGIAGCSADGGGGSGEIVPAGGVTWDSVSRPIGHAFLHLRTGGTTCCVGEKSSACSEACADANGLVTQAGYDKAADFYTASGQGDLTTLQAFKDYYNIPQPLVGESAADPAYRRRAHIVVYYNANELALGRELGCGERNVGDPEHYAVGCFVSNFGDTFASMADPSSATNRERNADGSYSGLHAAVGSTEQKATVVLSYDASRSKDANSGYRIQFGAYGPNGERIYKAQLDTMGPRPVPEVCMGCHGGHWDGDAGPAPYGLAKGARFLPLMTSTVVFPDATETPGQTLSDEEESIRFLNQLAWKVRGEGLTTRQQQAMTRMYDVTPSAICTTFTTDADCTTSHPHCAWQEANSDGSSARAAKCVDVAPDGTGSIAFKAQTPTSQDAASLHPPGYSTDTVPGLTTPAITQQQLYRNVLLRNCDTCHMAMDDTTSYAAFDSWATFTSAGPGLRAFMGLSGSANPETWHAGTFLMPHSQNLQARFWADSGGIDSAGTPVCQIANKVHPPADCFLKALGTARPTQPIPLEMQAASRASAPSDGDCGQARKDLMADGAGVTGYNSGRLAIEGLCRSGCRRAAGADVGVGCPGSEQVTTFLSTGVFHGTREECVPLAGDNPQGIGSCRPCGRLNQPACTQVMNTSCDVSFNPSCDRMPACHEGAPVDSGDGPICSAQPLTGTAQESSTAPTMMSLVSTGMPMSQSGPANLAIDGSNNTFARTAGGAGDWWTLDFGAARHVTSIGFYNSPDPDGLQNFVVQYADANGWTTVPGGNFANAGPATMGTVYTLINLSEAIQTQTIRIQNVGGPYLEIADVDVKGW